MNRLKTGRYTENDSMSKLISENYSSLLVLNRFGIYLGFGDKTIKQVCKEYSVDTNTFLAIINLLVFDYVENVSNVSLKEVMNYLHNSHAYFIDYRLPSIREKLVAVLDPKQKELNRAVIGYFDEYVSEVSGHMMYEEDVVFPYVCSMLKGEKKHKQSIQSKQHDLVEAKLTEFKSILIKYYPAKSSNELNTVLFDIFSCEQDLASHNAIEDHLFTPAVAALSDPETTTEALSSREKEIIICIVKGMTNKQIADHLFISTHTVISHRRNIANKLEIHSTAGLIIYAIVNNLVKLEEIAS